MTTVDICICTYKRPDSLRDCIQSLLSQKISGGITFKIIIVDNDSLQAGKKVVEGFSAKSKMPIVYISENKRGISYARNRCLDAIESDYFCFIDDDEIASPQWLHNLYQTLLGYDADIVAGPVIATYPEKTPRWVTKSKIFERPRRKTGEQIQSVATGNCIIKASVVRQTGIKFDHKFALSGGEDSDFFYRILSFGYKAVYCNDAEVFEEADRNRMTVRYWVRRAIRGGQTYAIIHYSEISIMNKVFLVGRKSLNLIFGVCITILSLPFGRSMYIRWLIKAAGSYGLLSGLRGKILEIY